MPRRFAAILLALILVLSGGIRNDPSGPSFLGPSVAHAGLGTWMGKKVLKGGVVGLGGALVANYLYQEFGKPRIEECIRTPSCASGVKEVLARKNLGVVATLAAIRIVLAETLGGKDPGADSDDPDPKRKPSQDKMLTDRDLEIIERDLELENAAHELKDYGSTGQLYKSKKGYVYEKKLVDPKGYENFKGVRLIGNRAVEE